MIGKIVKVIIDRPLGSYHPEYKEICYPVNYGYIEGITAPDGEEQDAYILGVHKPLSEYTGRVIAIIRRKDDIEEKWIVAPESSSYSKEQIINETAFMEQYFDSEIIMFEYRNLQAEEVERSLFDDFIRRQIVRKCFRKEQEKWVIKDDPFIDDWSEEDYRELILHLRSVISDGGFVKGAFYRGRLKGFVSVDAQPLGTHFEYLDLTNIHVSEDMRGKGIGKQLFLDAACWAREKDAEKLYISAHSAAESQAFYTAMGCRQAEYYHQAHVEAEPFDCQLEYLL